MPCRLWGIKLGAFEPVSDQLSLGQLSGNQFKVLMRGVTAPKEQVRPFTVTTRQCTITLKCVCT